MGIYDYIFDDKSVQEYDNFPVLNISNEIWLAFVQEITKWNETDIYVISFFIDYEEDNQSDIRLHFGYNTERQFKKEQCKEYDKATVRWNYIFWLQNETFCFGDDGLTRDLISVWLKQQKIKKYEAVEMFTEQIICAVREIHKCGIIKEYFGTEIPIIIHTNDYHENIANINIKANGEYLDREFVEYCIRDFNE
ncbi:MAG: hypothetical protein UIM53_04310 [Acutalibacteraceae bacterium]|nr:hypothetical protein [Acutalibacteraceae bacterium]